MKGLNNYLLQYTTPIAVRGFLFMVMVEAEELSSESGIDRKEALMAVLEDRGVISGELIERANRTADLTKPSTYTRADAFRFYRSYISMMRKYVTGAISVIVALFVSVSSLFAQYDPAEPKDTLEKWNNFTKFLLSQPGLPANPLPAAYYVPPDAVGIAANPAAEKIIREAVALLESSLDAMGLIKSGHIADLVIAEQILMGLANEKYGNKNIRAKPESVPGSNFTPFNENDFYLIQYLPKSGVGDPSAQQENAFTGSNAWYVMAVTEYMRAKIARGETPNPDIVSVAESICRAMILLQITAGEAQEGIVSGPSQTFGPTPNAAREYISMKDQAYAYAALNAMFQLTGKQDYKTAADKIWTFVSTAKVYTAAGVQQTGLLRRGTGTIVYYVKGIRLVTSSSRWIIER